MSQIIKSFMGVFMILFMTATSIGILSGFLSVVSAQNLHSAIICELEDSDYYGGVIKESFSKAKEAGDTLSMTLFYEDSSTKEINAENVAFVDFEGVEMAKVNLGFNVKIGIFGVNDEHVLSGYAR